MKKTDFIISGDSLSVEVITALDRVVEVFDKLW